MNTGGIAQLEVAIDALMAEDVVGGLGVKLGSAIIELERLQARLDAERARRLVAFDRSMEWTVDGSRSAGSWIAKRSRTNPAEVAHRVHVARMVSESALTRMAWECGRITTQHVNLIAKTKSSARADTQFNEFEAELVQRSMRDCPKVVAMRAREWRDELDDLLDRDGANSADCDRETRAAHFSRTIYGIGVLDARFDTENAAVIEAALNRAYERGHCEDDSRSPSAQRADALVDICTGYLAGMPATGNRPHVSLIADVNTVVGDTTGGSHTLNLQPLNANAVNRIRCNAIIQRASQPRVPDTRRQTKRARQRQQECNDMIQRINDLRAEAI